MSNIKLTWNGAEVACRFMDMNLARIDGEREQQKWVSQKFARSNAWIGLNDIQHERHFVNSDGCPQRIINASLTAYHSNRHCVRLSTSTGLKVMKCQQRFRFLCQKSDTGLRTPCGEIVLSKWRYNIHHYYYLGVYTTPCFAFTDL